MAATPDGEGYWLLQPDSIATSFTSPVRPANGPGGRSAVQIAAGQIGPDPDAGQGAFCNPYGPCEEWCALFATWVWNEVGIGIPRFGFVGSVFDWAAGQGLALPCRGRYRLPVISCCTAPDRRTCHAPRTWPSWPRCGPTGPSPPSTATPDRSPTGRWPSPSTGPSCRPTPQSYNGMPIYAYARP